MPGRWRWCERSFPFRSLEAQWLSRFVKRTPNNGHRFDHSYDSVAVPWIGFHNFYSGVGCDFDGCICSLRFRLVAAFPHAEDASPSKLHMATRCVKRLKKLGSFDYSTGWMSWRSCCTPTAETNGLDSFLLYLNLVAVTGNFSYEVQWRITANIRRKQLIGWRPMLKPPENGSHVWTRST